MPTIFEAAEARSSAALDLVMGKRFLITPWKPGRYTGAGSPDELAPIPYTLRGLLGGAFGTMKGGGDRAGNDFLDRAQNIKRTVQFDISNFTDQTPAPQANWHVQSLDEPGQPSYEIVSIDDEKLNRIHYTLVTI